MTQTNLVTLTCLMLPLAIFAADAPTVDKSDYSLFNPVPDDQLRPLTSEVYDGVLDARTLDVGHVQVESGLVNYYHESRDGNFFMGSYKYTSEAYLWEPRITVGVLNHIDVYVRPSYETTSEETKATYQPSGFVYSNGSHASKFERVTTGVEINLWGNDGGITALAIKPYLSIPTDGGDVLGGSDVALLVRLPKGFFIKVDSEVYATENNPENDRLLYEGFDNSMSLNKSLGSKAGAYWYLDSTVTTNPNQQWYGYTGFGLNYNLTSNLQVNGGIGFGLTSAAYDYNPRLSFAWRF